MPGYTVLVCPTCGGKTSVSAESALAECMYCGNQIILRPGELAGAPEPQRYNPSDLRPLAPRPASVQVSEDGGSLTITRRWYSPKYIFMAVFALFWDGFLVFWYSMAFSGNAPLIFVIFPILHVAVGFYLTYSTLAGFLNTSTVRVTPQEFSVTHAPLPWTGEVQIPAREIEQLYTHEITRRTKNGTSTSYTLSAVVQSGRKLDLLRNLDTPDAGLFIEHQVEEWLRIPNRPVAGGL